MNTALQFVPMQAMQAARPPTATDIKARVQLIQEVMRAVMKPDVHYGIIPGTDKPALLKPGSEVLLATFQIAPSIVVEDLSTEDSVRYRVRVIGTHSPTGTVLGEGIGECSSNESKYKWRKAYDDEYNATPENRRRITFGKYKNKQVRTEPADVANTILKMAKKRAQIDMTLTATGASDCFEQDLDETISDGEHVEVRRQEPSKKDAVPERQPYSSEQFNANLPKYRELIESGARTAEQIIAMLDSRAILSSEQRATLNAITPKSEQPADSESNAEQEGAAQ